MGVMEHELLCSIVRLCRKGGENSEQEIKNMINKNILKRRLASQFSGTYLTIGAETQEVNPLARTRN